MLHKRILLLLTFFIITFGAFAISYQFDEKIDWKPIQKVNLYEGLSIERLVFQGSNYNKFEPVPHFLKTYPIHSSFVKLSATIENTIVVATNEHETKLLKECGYSDTTFSIEIASVSTRKEPFARVDLVPIRWNDDKLIFEKLVSFQIKINVEDIPELTNVVQETVENSVLASGDWFKIRVSQSGIHKITYQELNEMGFNVEANPRNIAVFGNGGGVLPELNADFRYQDLQQNPIVVVGESDGKFDPSDYILFYAQGPVVWKYNPVGGRFNHQTNYYDDYAYYFITSLNSTAKRISDIPPVEGAASVEVTEFSDYAYHEIEKVNLAGSGRIWYGELFDFNSTYSFDFDFPNTVTTEMAYFKGDFASVAETPSQFEITINGNEEAKLIMPTISPTSAYQVGRDKSTSFDFKIYGDQVNVQLNYIRTSNSSAGYLNYFDLNVKRRLKMADGQLLFREALPPDDTVKYKLSGANESVQIWDVTEAVNPGRVDAKLVGSTLEFLSTTTSLKEYIAFDGSSYYSTEFVEAVNNQNLHSLRNIDFLIISHPDFIDQAKKLADFHQKDNFTVYITTPSLIYNEFSSGAQDVTAIRDFVKMLYDESDPGKEIEYLLLFGDASYDYKYTNQTVDDMNFIPCWESLESLNIVWSVATDDYFGYLDDNEGNPNSNIEFVDIGIGRFVVSTVDQAEMAVNKSIHYGTNTDDIMGPWRTILSFIADDEDNHTHLTHAEYLSDYVQDFFPVYNIDKIYLDAYNQISTPAGQRAPDVNNAINQRMDKGTLIVNYNGHGGEVGLGHERFLQLADINSWTNYDKMPIFITATCEFSRYDDPTRISAGEQVFLNENGGAIALFSTARATFASSNLSLNAAIYDDNIFTKKGGKYPRFGDIIRQSKVLGGENDKKFILLGDPALELAYPDYGVQTMYINQNLVVEDQYDTIRALEKVRVEGTVVDENGNPLNSFNGTLFPTVYDKFSEIQTFGDKGSPTTFKLRQNILFNGKASINNGEFMFEFIVPRDIAYNYGTGRISYYLKSDSEDGAGYYEGIIIGGYDENAFSDNEGPVIELFINDTTFVSGDITDQNPILLARVSDESGINTTGNGIGHDIIATVDDEKSESHTLNKYYEADRDSYTSGNITYPFSNLANGEHTLSLKVWDIYNNSSTAYLKFLVTSAEQLVIQNLINYPNPFISSTNFVFDHNQSGQELNVKIFIYNSAGAHIKTIEKQITPEGYKSTPIHWDGSTDAGGFIGRGFYVYRTVVQNQEGNTAQDQSKLVFIR